LTKLLIALPFGLATIVGGLECTASAAAAGDEYDTRSVLLVQGLASLGAGLCGGVVQNTPYFGHPAYHKMGARLIYPLATGLFLGVAGYFGWFVRLWEFMPQVVMFPVIVYIGLQTISHCYQSTPARDYPALALATLPVLAFVALIPLDPVVDQLGRRTQELREVRSAAGASVADLPLPRDLRVNKEQTAELFKAQQNEKPKRGQEFQVIEGALLIQTLRCLGNGFVLTSLLWAAALTALLDRRPVASSLYLLLAAAFSLVGLIHSPLREGGLAWPHKVLLEVPDPFLPAAVYQTPFHWAAGYALAAGVLLVSALFPQKEEAGQAPAPQPAPVPTGNPADEQTLSE
jgi:AGZA family xanthine/uracil permease-like MFS transporter